MAETSEGARRAALAWAQGQREQGLWLRQRKLVLASAAVAGSAAGDSKLSLPGTPRGGPPGTACKTVAGWIREESDHHFAWRGF